MAESDATIDIQHIPAFESTHQQSGSLFQLPDDGIQSDEVEKDLILQALKKAKGNKTTAADLLGITRRRLYSMMERFSINNSPQKDE